MAYANLTNTPQEVLSGIDSVVIIDNFQSIRGGVTLDVTSFDPTVINAGHVIIVETATGTHKPMPISGNAYAALPANHTYAGILVATIQTSRPFAGVMVRGTVNPTAVKYQFTPILGALKTALPLIDFRADL